MKCKTKYTFSFEIAGDIALFNQPKASPFSVTYPIPTLSAVESWIKAVSFVYGAEPVVEKLNICSPIKTWRYSYLNTTDMRNDGNKRKNAPDIMSEVCLTDVCYQIFGFFVNNGKIRQDITAKNTPGYSNNPAHFYHDTFKRNLRRGRYRQVPYLGHKEFMSDYIGPLRIETKIQEDINLKVDDMLIKTFSGFTAGEFLPLMRSVEVKNGVVIYEN